MPIIALLSSKPALWLDFLQTLENDSGAQTVIMTTAGEVLNAARQKDLLAVILGPEIDASAGTEIVQQLIFINAMIHVAWASDMTEEDFHEFRCNNCGRWSGWNLFCP